MRKRTREEEIIPGTRSPSEQPDQKNQPNFFFKPLNMGTFPPPAGSPAVKVKSPSAVFEAAFMETGVIPRNLSVSL